MTNPTIDAARHAADLLSGTVRFARYRDDPVGFVTEVLGETLWSKEREILEALIEHRHVAVTSCHEAGKSFTAARAVAWWLSFHPPGEAFAVTTAPTFPQVRAILWREIGRAHRKGDLPGKVNQTEWWMGPEIVAFGRKPADYDPAAFQGIHARAVLVVIDEAAGVPPALWDAVEGLVANEQSRVLAIGHPDNPTSRFARACMSGWNTIRISAFDTPNFTDEPISDHLRDLLVGPVWVEERRAEWGEDSPLWTSRVLGEFPQTADDALFPLAWVQTAVDRALEPADPVELGVDVARYGSDKTIVSVRRGPVWRVVSEHGQGATTETTGWVNLALDETGARVAKVDEVGVGAGVVDQLVEQGKPVEGLNAGSSPRDPERFANARAEWYWELRGRFEVGDIDIPDDPELIGQLTAIRYKPDSRGRIRIESKENLRKRGLPSPDKADALMLAFAEQTIWIEGPLGV